MGYDDTLRDEPRTWAALVSRAGKTVRFTDADLRRLHQWEEKLRNGDAGVALYNQFIQEKGTVLAELLYRFVVKKDGLEVIEYMMDWPARSGKLVLRLLLDDLVARRLLG